jgi:RNA polymerase sigma-70 factor (ECF subfamily)
VKKIDYREPEQFRLLVEQQQQRILSVCWRFVRNTEQAEDIAQEVFVKAWHSLDGFRGDSSIQTWLYRIAVSMSLDFLRKEKRNKRMPFWKDASGLDAMVTEPAAQGETPEEELIRQRRERILQQTLAKLPQKQRVALSLSTWDGLSNKEVADIMKTTVSSVESLIHRGRRTMKKMLEKQYETLRSDTMLPGSEV